MDRIQGFHQLGLCLIPSQGAKILQAVGNMAKSNK